MQAAGPESIVRARKLHCGVPAERSLSRTKLPVCALYHWLDGTTGCCAQRSAIACRRAPLSRRARPLRVDRSAMVARLWRAAEQKAREIETRLARGNQKPADRECDARALAMLVMALRELANLGLAHGPINRGLDDSESGPRDLEEFRRDLARSLDALLASPARCGVSGGLSCA